jgi:CRP-like cAMP-binding protein
MDQATLIETLSGIRFLQGIPRKNLEQIASVALYREYRAADVVFREGEIADSAYFVVSGKLSLELSPSTIFRKSLVNVGPGEMLGWSSLIEHSHFAATAVVIEPAQLVRIDGACLRMICQDDPQFGYEFMRRAMWALAKRLTSTWTQLAQVYISPNAPVAAPTGD